MKTIPLRQLVREPLRVKKWTRAGQSVQVTDNGEPLWVLQPAAKAAHAPERSAEIDELLDEVLQQPSGKVSATQLLEESRR